MNRTERVMKIIDHYDLNYVDFGSKIGVKRQLVANWKSYQQEIPDKYILSIIEQFPEIEARWLITGEGEMLIADRATTADQLEGLKRQAWKDVVADFRHEQDKVRKSYEEAAKMKDQLIEVKERLIESKDDLIHMLKNPIKKR